MTALAAGSSYSFTMDPHGKLTLVVTGKATLSFASDAPNLRSNFVVTDAQSRTYGPYGAIGTMTITAVDQSLDYTIESGVPMLSDDGASLVDGAGNQYPLGQKMQIPGGAFCTWQSATGTLAMVSVDAGDDIALDTAVTLDGLSSAKCTWSNAASGTFLADYTFTNEVSLAGFKTIQIPVKITANLTASNVGLAAAPLQLWIYLSGGSSIRLQCDFANIPPDSWHVFSFSRESPAGLVTFGGGATWASLDTLTVTKVRVVQATVTASASYPVWLGALRCDARAKGCVSIVMDGCYISQYTVAKPVLDTYSIKTSLAIVNSYLGSSASYMTLAQADALYRNGHECIHHTYDGTKTNGYVNATDWPTAAAIAIDIKAGFAYFITQGWTRGLGKIVNAFANSFVPGTAVARQQLIQSAANMAGVQCSRASVGLYTTQMCLGYSSIKPFHVRGAMQITSTDTAAAIKTVIDQAEANGEWAVLTFHRVVDSGAGSLETTTAIFNEVCAYLDTRRSAGRLDVLPFGEAYDKYFA